LAKLDELRPKHWWDALSPYHRTEALKAVGAKDDEAGILAAWNHHNAKAQEELNRHPSQDKKITKD
jgi:hypothetical protein